jgi:diaminopimelate epimerase
MALRFTKMHGLGNDYVYISTFDQHVAAPEQLAPRIADRHRGVGGDGLILVAPPDVPDAHVRMIMFNADGSRAQMCGNGIRCVAKLAYDHRLARANPLRVQTDRGVLVLELTLTDGRVSEVRVDMGEPILAPARIPARLPGERIVNVPFPSARGGEQISSFVLPDLPQLALTAVSMGNPHAVFFVPNLADVPLHEWGPRLETHELFPERINVHFVQVLAPDHVRMVTWERGSGATQACGTGAAAVCVAGVLNGRTQRVITADLPGGALKLEWNAGTNHVFKTGPATEVFAGVWPE